MNKYKSSWDRRYVNHHIYTFHAFLSKLKQSVSLRCSEFFKQKRLEYNEPYVNLHPTTKSKIHEYDWNIVVIKLESQLSLGSFKSLNGL